MLLKPKTTKLDLKYLANRVDSSGGVVLIALARELAISE